MTMQDPIADMLTRVRNAQMAGHESVSMPDSKLKKEIARVLQEEGYVAEFRVDGAEGAKPVLTLDLKYHEGSPVIRELHRVSRPGLRRYCQRQDLPRVRGGLGIAIISSSQGVVTDRRARSMGVGGEVLCTVF